MRERVKTLIMENLNVPRTRPPPPSRSFSRRIDASFLREIKKKKNIHITWKNGEVHLYIFHKAGFFPFFLFFFLAMTLCPEWFWTMTNCRERIVVSKILFSFAFCQSCVTDSCIRVPQTVLRRIKIFILFVLLSPLYLDTWNFLVI